MLRLETGSETILLNCQLVFFEMLTDRMRAGSQIRGVCELTATSRMMLPAASSYPTYLHYHYSVHRKNISDYDVVHESQIATHRIYSWTSNSICIDAARRAITQCHREDLILTLQIAFKALFIIPKARQRNHDYSTARGDLTAAFVLATHVHLSSYRTLNTDSLREICREYTATLPH